MKTINIAGAREHNLKNIDVEIPRGNFIVITGVSGSGKSSLAFDTLFAEAQRRFMESLSSYARQFVDKLDKPDLDFIEGLSPSVSVDQKTFHRNPRSTVGTITEIYDYLRVLFSRIGIPYCHECGIQISSQTLPSMVDKIFSECSGKTVFVYSPIVQGRKGEYRKELADLKSEGFLTVMIDGELFDLDDEINLSRHKKHTIELLVDSVVIKNKKAGERLQKAISISLRRSGGIVRCKTEDGSDYIFSEHHSCPNCGISYPEISPRLFSFNSPYGACSGCNGLGVRTFFDPELIIENPGISIEKGAITPFKNSKYMKELIENVCSQHGISLTKPFEKLSKKNKEVLLYGTGDEKIKLSKKKKGWTEEYYENYPGITGILSEWYESTDSDEYRDKLGKYIRSEVCTDCGGSRLNKTSLSIKINKKNIADIIELPIEKLYVYFKNLELHDSNKIIGERIVTEILSRAGFLKDVGLSYLSLNRSAPTLSGGEAQRIRLATQVGSNLTGITYVLDEPSIGLHQKDNRKLIDTLKTIRDNGNTVIVVEHDEETIRSADYIIDVGPGAGELGGELVSKGDVKNIIRAKKSITGKYLSGKMEIKVPEKRKKAELYITVEGAREHNLKNIDAKFPIGLFTCITGVSGSGKSTLVVDILFRQISRSLYRSKIKPGEHKKITGINNLKKIVEVDQNPIGRTPRSNPATYTGIFTEIRELFSMLPESKIRGYKPGRFSFNLKQGSCSACKGDGKIKIEMHFLPDVYVDCEVCEGKRYNDETLTVEYRGKTISDVLDMTVSEANQFFENVPGVNRKLSVLNEVGLGYIRLGQQATTLSGGEAQRIKLSKELSKNSSGNTLYILDEPTVGLHFDDINKLLNVIYRLRDLGNTVIVIEHNLDIIKCADHVIDLGPEGGEKGGTIVAEGTPEQVAKVKKSHTGKFLKEII